MRLPCILLRPLWTANLEQPMTRDPEHLIGEVALVGFVRRGANDRDPLRAMRPATFLSGRKFFVAAELFTVGGGELPWALLAAG